MDNKGIRMTIGISFNIILIVVSVLIIFSVGSKAFAFGARIFDEQAVDTSATAREVEVTLTTDNVSAKQLAKILYDKGLIEDKTVFSLQVQLSDYNNKFPAGTYTLRTDMTPTELMEAICTSTEESEVSE